MIFKGLLTTLMKFKCLGMVNKFIMTCCLPTSEVSFHLLLTQT